MMLNEALNYAANDWAIFPLNGKVPLTRHGLKDASTDEQQIYAWWRRWPAANIGYALHPGLLVLDIDPRHNGSTNLAKLTSEHGPIPETMTCISGREDGGCHFYLIRPPGPLTGSKLPEGIDLRLGGKHYLVAPPSIHPDSGKRYRWADHETQVATTPHWLTDLLRPPLRPATPPASREGSNGQGLVTFVADLQEGNRNHGLFWSVCTAVSDGVWPDIREDIKSAARSIGLTDHEIEATCASAERRAER